MTNHHQSPEILYRDPKTGECLTAAQWCKRLGESRETFENRIKRLGTSNINSFVPVRDRKKYTHPETQESLTARQWAKRLKIEPYNFYHRISRYGENNPRTYLRRADSPTYKCPTTGTSLSATQWAERLGISPTAFAQRVDLWGLDDPRTFQVGKISPERSKRILNPGTQEALTRQQWAQRLEITPEHFDWRVKRWGLGDPRTFQPKGVKRPSREITHLNPATRERLTKAQWANRLRISVSAFKGRLGRYGEGDPRVFAVWKPGIQDDGSWEAIREIERQELQRRTT